jgi:hypothetical protein
LPQEFPSNPFCAAFGKVDAAVRCQTSLWKPSKSKRSFAVRKPSLTWKPWPPEPEQEREPFAAVIKQAFVPVTHILKIEVAL